MMQAIPEAVKAAIATLAAWIGQPATPPAIVSPLSVTPKLVIPDTVVASTDRVARVAVTLSEPARRPLSWRCLTSNGTAYAPAFYRTTDVTLIFQPGETVKVVEVPLLRDLAGKDLKLTCGWPQMHPPLAGAVGVIRSGPVPSAAPVAGKAAFAPAARTEGRKLAWQSDFLEAVTPEGGPGKWRSRFGWGRVQAGNGEIAPYADASTDPGVRPHQVIDGKRTLVAEYVPTKDSGKDYAFSATMLSSQGAYSFQHGYIELRAKMDRAAGTVPAFWLLPASGAWPPEIDIFEIGLGGGGQLTTSIHFKDQAGVKAHEGVTIPFSPDDKAWHTYGLDWTREWLVTYIDGVEVARRPTPADFNVPMYVIVNIAVGGLAPNPTGGTGWSSTMTLDYVKVWQ